MLINKVWKCNYYLIINKLLSVSRSLLLLSFSTPCFPSSSSFSQSKSNKPMLDANLPVKHQDGKITRKEILANWNMFVGSQATNYGEDLTKRHDELWWMFRSSFGLIFHYFGEIWLQWFWGLFIMDPAHPHPPRNTNPFRFSMHLHTVYVNTDDADDPTHTVLSILFTYPFDF